MLNYFYLSDIQKITLIITTILFGILILIIRPIILDYSLESRNILVYTTIFFAWYGLTIMFTNTLTFETTFRSILKN